MIRTTLAFLLALAAAPAAAQMQVEHATISAAGPMAQAAAAYFTVTNTSDTADRLVGVTTGLAAMAELHRTEETDDGLVRMVPEPDGFAIEPGETLVLEQGGRHVMLMGLSERPEDGAEAEITLQFEHADPVTLTVPVTTILGGHSGHDSDG
ncbi:copper chaperone PCu(A)C [Rhodobacterales bacterium HKCCE3408]|nr:copper chaperone PCu(A)C [Rhodobacterales bacterium HKCCE3408]